MNLCTKPYMITDMKIFGGTVLTLRFVIKHFNPDRLGTIIMYGKSKLLTKVIVRGSEMFIVLSPWSVLSPENETVVR